MEKSDADGIHLGQEDSLDTIIKRVNHSKIIGVTVNSIEQAKKAINLGADYLGTDSVFESTTKPGVSMGIKRLKEIANYSSVPVVGIGGINKSNVQEVLSSKVSGIAVSSAILASNSFQTESNRLKEIIYHHKEEEMKSLIAESFDKIKELSPLVLNITNNVVMNQTANGCINIGASPIMSHAIEEMDDLVSISKALNVNIGTLTSSQIEAILVAGRKANQINVPVTLDPVGVGASKFRKEMTKKLLDSINFSIIKGNQSEISFFLNDNVKQKGVDSADSIDNIDRIVKCLSQKFNGSVICATGKIDTISNGMETYQLLNESDMLGKITGTGCLAGALISCFSGVSGNHLVAGCGGISALTIAAEKAKYVGSYSFKVSLFDELSNLKSSDFKKYLKIKKLKLQSE